MENKLENIVLIGPVYPYKGGIAHYTGLMYRALAKEHDVTMISYKMQYPKLLFKKEQRDYSNKTFQIENTQYLINTANPWNWIKVANRIKKMKPDMVIVQWWHPYFAPCYWTMSKILKNVKILYVCHNVFPHERFPMDRILTKMVLKNGDRYIVQSSTDEKDLLGMFPEAVYKKTVHPTYNAFKLTDITQDEAREKLKLNKEDKVLLFFGFVRKYKGLDYLIKAMPKLVVYDKNIRLLIVGDFDKDRQEYEKMMENIGVKDNILVFDGYIPDNEVENYFMASDVVVCPYLSATQSGIVQIAYGFDKPVIVTNVGGLPDVVTEGQTGYIVEAKSEIEIAHAVVKFYSKDKNEYVNSIKREAKKYLWDRMVEIVEKLASNYENNKN